MSFQFNVLRDLTPLSKRRKVVGGVLGLSLLVASGAAAQASGHGDGFLGPGTGGNTAAPTGTTAPTATVTITPTTSPTMTTSPVPTATTAPMQGFNGWVSTVTGMTQMAFLTLGSQKDRTFNQLLGINDSGAIVGYFGSGADAMHPNKGYLINPPYSPLSFVDKNFPGSVQTQVIGVNNAGIKVGFFVDGAGATHGFVRWNTTWRKVDFRRTTSKPMVNQLLGINNRGIAAGFFNDSKDQSHGYLYNIRTGRFALLRLPVVASSVVATGVNDRGEVVGFYVTGKNTKAFTWSGRSFRTVSLGNGTNTQALGVNNAGSVVGSFVDAAGKMHGFLWSAGQAHAVDVPGSAGTVVNGLNNRGQIVGFSMNAAKQTLGFVATR